MPEYSDVRPFISIFYAWGPVQYSLRTVYTIYILSQKTHIGLSFWFARWYHIIDYIFKWRNLTFPSIYVFHTQLHIAEIIQDHWINLYSWIPPQLLPQCMRNLYIVLFFCATRRDSKRSKVHSCTCIFQGVTKRCRLSWLTNSAHVRVYEPQCGISANEYSCARSSESWE